MGATSINLTHIDTGAVDGGQSVLTTKPEMRIVMASFLAPLVVFLVGVYAYLLPSAIDRDYKVAGLIFIVGISLGAVVCLFALYEGLSKAVYRVTVEHVEEEYGIFNKRLRRIPLSYVRDVTYDQNLVQAIFAVSSVTVSPTNGNKIVLSNIRGGEGIREIIWKLVLSNSPGG